MGKWGRQRKGLGVLAEALVTVDKTGERFYEAELYRLKGSSRSSPKSKVEGPKSESPITTQSPPSRGRCFLKAIEIAQRQQAKSLELRAVMSLVRLRQQQAAQSESRNTGHASRTRLNEAHQMLAEVYGWFTEGFDTTDLQEAKALLVELSG